MCSARGRGSPLNLRDRGKIDLSEAFVDATYAGAKKGALRSVQRAVAKGTKIMAICDRHGLPLAVHVASASPHEPHLVPATLDARFLRDAPDAPDRRSRATTAMPLDARRSDATTASR